MNPGQPVSNPPAAPIGVFDSGVGGLSVLRALRRQLPAHPLIYLADQDHVPYGQRPLMEVRAFSEAISRLLISMGARVVVVACNTASAAALHHLRQALPATPFIGMEPAVKPAAEQTHNGVVGVLATPATFQGELYASVVERFAGGVRILQDTCPGLVEWIEAGNLEGPQTRRILESALHPMLEEGIDRVVLGCTHYPFVIPLIERIISAYPGRPAVQVIDPAPAVARQAGRILEANGWLDSNPVPAGMTFLTSGDPRTFAASLPGFLGEGGPVQGVSWSVDGSICLGNSATGSFPG